MKIVQPPDFVIKSKNGTAGFLWDKKFAIRKNADVLKVQKYVDSTVLRLMKPYTPFKNGVLEKSATLSTVIGLGEIHQNTPYARYLYYGKVYGPNIPIIENGEVMGFFSPKGKKKRPTGAALVYSKAKHPLAGKMWFERMKADKRQIILKGAAKVAGGTAK